jgi:N-acylneuraminate cytidylyltransferase
MISNELNEKLKKVKLLVMDVDGVLTDSGMYYNEKGEELKKFSTRDGMGITLLRINGIKTAIITSENSPIARARANKLKIDYVILNNKNKIEALKELLEQSNVDKSECAYMGDDINDYEAMQHIEVSACPSDSVDSIRNAATYICAHDGGKGAVREFAELILKSKNIEIKSIKNWE